MLQSESKTHCNWGKCGNFIRLSLLPNEDVAITLFVEGPVFTCLLKKHRRAEHDEVLTGMSGSLCSKMTCSGNGVCLYLDLCMYVSRQEGKSRIWPKPV